jgi:two-component sensor histidine kinase
MPPSDLSSPAEPTARFPLCAAQCPLLAEVSHRTANQFAVLTSYIRLSLEEFRRNPGEVRDLQLAFAAVEARARALASLNRHLLETRAATDPEDVSVILHQVAETFASDTGDLHSIIDAVTGSYLVTPGVKLAVGQIVTEAVMNSLKYAYPDEIRGDIIIRSSLADTGDLIVEIADYGRSGQVASLSTAAKTLGVRLMRGLASQENIGLSFIPTSPGLCVRLLLPSAVELESELEVEAPGAG